MDKRFLTILAVIAAAFIGVIIFAGGGNNNSGNGGNSQAQPTNHIKGQGQKKVTLTEYGDFQCPACLSYYPTVTQVVEKYKQDIYFQFRHLPLVTIHQNAFSAARAAEAAALQGKFFEMYDKLYTESNWNAWTTSQSPRTLFEKFAKEIGLDVSRFSTDYASEKVNDAINADVAAFDKTGTEKSTPSFFINGKHVENSQLLDANGRPSVESFSRVIDQAISQQNKQ